MDVNPQDELEIPTTAYIAVENAAEVSETLCWLGLSCFQLGGCAVVHRARVSAHWSVDDRSQEKSKSRQTFVHIPSEIGALEAVSHILSACLVLVWASCVPCCSPLACCVR